MFATGSTGLDKTLTLGNKSLALLRLSFPLSYLLGIFEQLCFPPTYQQSTYRERYVTEEERSSLENHTAMEG